MKLRLSLKNSARHAALSFFLAALLLFSGCTSSTSPTFFKENIEDAIQDICQKEYNIYVKTKLTGATLWIYLPLEDIYAKKDKPEKYLERFIIEENKNEFKDNGFRLEYLIKPIPEEEKLDEYKYNKDALDKINNTWKVLRRVLFSMERSKGQEPQFFWLVTADIKYGFLMKELFYLTDLKKVSYEFISWTEFQHRTIQDMENNFGIIGDKEGKVLDYKEANLADFIAMQIQHRIKLKFQKPEVKEGADIDKEITKIIANTVRIYDFRDFSEVELSNLASKNKLILNRAALLSKPSE